jgi:hypothetical protein
VVRFLRHLLRHIPGPLLVILDGAPIHRGRAVKDFLRQFGNSPASHIASLRRTA